MSLVTILEEELLSLENVVGQAVLLTNMDSL